MLGVVVGFALGAAVFLKLGLEVGFLLGLAVGFALGALVFLKLGLEVGFVLGLVVGFALGAVGFRVVGRIEGDNEEGSLLGFEVGEKKSTQRPEEDTGCLHCGKVLLKSQ